ncbi:M1 family metallopeptidase [Aureispira]|nr:M1 family metallopeptidase [Aureispira sp.]
MISKYFFTLIMASFFFIGCKTNSRLITTDVVVENRTLDTLSVTAPKTPNFERPTYNPAFKRINDLLHTKLEINFDWKNQYLKGVATLDLKPIFYPTNALRLDAKGFDIHEISMVGNDGKIPLKYKYNNNKDLFITLDRTYKSTEEYRITIDYTAKPNELPIGGSNAITSDKGLYFINPLGKEVGKPQQIWTQGETESSSCWFPTIDRPNERCTQEIFITVEKKYKTLSNGHLKNSITNTDGTRTDHWTMDLPHAPYLFAMIVGEFAVVSEKWNGKLLEYYVEQKYEKDAKKIYKNTPEMLTFFSEVLGVDYPWNKYSQIIVRDYVSGAMENTTAVIFGDFIQMTSRELIDRGDLNESIVAHEMMHHWFGDLVTCESWANLPLNESFANYSEYLWFEHKYGRDAADYIRKNQIEGYFNQAVIGGDKHPLINFGYDDKEDMFDAHSYNKGGTILHMLRYVVGDTAFFASLNKYLEDNKFQAVEFHHLRLAFESVTGQDLNWFFNQWFLTAGHPILEVTKNYDANTKTLNVTLNQTQDFKESTVFILPFAIDVYTAGNQNPKRTNVVMTKQEQTFSIKVESSPVWVAVDAERVILSKFKYKQSKEELIQQYYLSKRFQDRYDAIKSLKYLQKGNPLVLQVFEDAIQDPFWAIRQKAIDAIVIENDNNLLIEKLISIAKDDLRSHVRAAAIEKIGALNNLNYLNIAREAIDNDQSYSVITAALHAINSNDAVAGIQNAEKLMNVDNPTLLNGIAAIFEKTGHKKYTNFYEQNWSKTDNYSRFTFFNSYATLLLNSNDVNLTKEKVSYLKSISTNNNVSQWGRYASSNALKKMRSFFFRIVEKEYKEITKRISDIKGQNTKDALDKLKVLLKNKSKSNSESTLEAVKALNDNSITEIIMLIEAFSKENIYDLITNAIQDIKNWEQNSTLLKLYRSW